MCHKRGCESKGKSVRRADLEGEFEEMLKSTQPSEQLIDLSKAMFKKAWNVQSQTEADRKAALKRNLADAEKKLENFLDRIVEAEPKASASYNPSVISAYEKRVAQLEP